MSSAGASAPASPIQWNAVYRKLTERDISLKAVTESKRRFRARESVSGVWPSRLLHIDSMRSFPKENGDRYKRVRRPPFTILSYKWGFWVVEGQQSELEITGINWSMPAIDPKYFTVDELTKVLKKMRQYAEFTWLDVACVDQFLSQSTLQDIVVEPRNFRLGTKAFAWWVDFAPDMLSDLLNAISETDAALVQLSSASKVSVSNDLEHFPSVLLRGLESFLAVIGIPWFSSNWTLREIMLCEKVIILNREGDPIRLKNRSGELATIDMIARICNTILAWLKRVEKYSIDAIPLGKAIVIDRPPLSSASSATSAFSDRAEMDMTVAMLVAQCLKLVEEKGPFFLYATAPDIMHHWTMVLLRTSRLVLNHRAGEAWHADTCQQMQYGGWGGGMYIECVCLKACRCQGPASQHDEYECLRLKENQDPDSELCIPCLLNISYHMSPKTIVTAHTKISPGHYRSNEEDDLKIALQPVNPQILLKHDKVRVSQLLNGLRQYVDSV